MPMRFGHPRRAAWVAALTLPSDEGVVGHEVRAAQRDGEKGQRGLAPVLGPQHHHRGTFHGHGRSVQEYGPTTGELCAEERAQQPDDGPYGGGPRVRRLDGHRSGAGRCGDDEGALSASPSRRSTVRSAERSRMTKRGPSGCTSSCGAVPTSCGPGRAVRAVTVRRGAVGDAVSPTSNRGCTRALTAARSPGSALCTVSSAGGRASRNVSAAARGCVGRGPVCGDAAVTAMGLLRRVRGGTKAPRVLTV